MNIKKVTNFLRGNLLLLVAVGVIVASVCTIAVLTVKTDDAQETVSKAMSASTTIPYVTNSTAFVAYLRDRLKESGPELVQLEIKELYADAPGGEQHMSFHYLGEVLYEFSGANALPQCEDWYGFACYHGVLLSAVDTEGYEVVPFLDEACFKMHGRTMDTETCQHGIGHGLLEFSGRNPSKAIEACDLVDDVYSKLGCASGVFMEYFAPTQSIKHGRISSLPVFDKNNPLNVCSDFTGKRQATCLFEIQSWWQEAGKVSPRGVEALCNSVENEEAREFCLIGYGNFKGPYVAVALPYCDEFVELESRTLCRAGILWSAEHHNDSPEPLGACSDLPEGYRATCIEKGRFTCEVDKKECVF